MPRPETVDIAQRGEIFVRSGHQIRASIAAKVNDHLMKDMTNSMNEIEKIVDGFDASDLVGLIVGMTEPDRLSAKGKVVRELAMSASKAKQLGAELAAVAHNLDENIVYVLNFEQIMRYGLDVFGKA